MAAAVPALFPEMKPRGASPGDLVALLAATRAQTEAIPPSLVPITIGSVTGVSISALSGGLLPGVVLAIMQCSSSSPWASDCSPGRSSRLLCRL
jgi:TRAP-type C4-dicarboxylate transport system permease large subunit